MDIAKIREFRLANPFKPFNLVLDSGKHLLVDHPFFLSLPPTGDYVIWSALDGGFKKIETTRVRRIVPATSSKSGRGDNGHSGK